MKYLFAHNHVNKVKTGDKVKVGDYIGEVGTANGQWLAHLHLSTYENLSDSQVKGYVNGWSQSKIEQYYFDPVDVFNVNSIFDEQVDIGNLGYDWLQSYGKGLHPGVDVNGLYGGNTDIGYKFKSPVDGVVTFAGDWGSGWGLCILIEANNSENNMSEENHEVEEIMKTAKEVFNIDAGSRINKREDDEIAHEIKELSDDYIELITEHNTLKDSYTKLTAEKKGLIEAQEKLTVAHDKEISKLKQEIEDNIEDAQKPTVKPTIGFHLKSAWNLLVDKYEDIINKTK